jgi:hypothetical protein
MTIANMLKGIIVALLSGILIMLFKINQSINDTNQKMPEIKVYSIKELKEIRKEMEEEEKNGTEDGPAYTNFNEQTVFQVEGNVNVDGYVDVSGSSVKIDR